MFEVIIIIFNKSVSPAYAFSSSVLAFIGTTLEILIANLTLND